MALEMSLLKVLVADDHMLVWQYVRNALNDAHIFNVQFADSGNKSVEMIKDSLVRGRPYDIIFLDWNMPEISGIDVLTCLRNKPEFDNTAVVMLTAESELKSVKKAISAGATSYIVKPPTAADLAKKLNEVFEWLKKKRGEVPNVINDRG